MVGLLGLLLDGYHWLAQLILLEAFQLALDAHQVFLLAHFALRILPVAACGHGSLALAIRWRLGVLLVALSRFLVLHVVVGDFRIKL